MSIFIYLNVPIDFVRNNLFNHKKRTNFIGTGKNEKFQMFIVSSNLKARELKFSSFDHKFYVDIDTHQKLEDRMMMRAPVP